MMDDAKGEISISISLLESWQRMLRRGVYEEKIAVVESIEKKIYEATENTATACTPDNPCGGCELCHHCGATEEPIGKAAMYRESGA